MCNKLALTLWTLNFARVKVRVRVRALLLYHLTWLQHHITHRTVSHHMAIAPPKDARASHSDN